MSVTAVENLLFVYHLSIVDIVIIHHNGYGNVVIILKKLLVKLLFVA